MPNGVTKLERLQREYTRAYKEQLELYRTAHIFWAVITRDGYILLTNPYWSELGYTAEDLRLRMLYPLFPNHHLLLMSMLNLHVQSIVEQPLMILDKVGRSRDLLCWMSAFIEKASGTWVANFNAVLRD